eukprot:scaffold5184_cov39-Cyclotella_meneghiniana.AAC.4
MSEACFTARATLRTQVRDLINELPLNCNESGQYNHDDITVFIKGVERHFKGLYNPLHPGQGLSQLLAQGPNTLTKLKSTDMFAAAAVLKQSAKEAAALAKQTGVDEKAQIATRADAQDEADRRNYAIQAAIGSDITDSVLRNADGNDNKSVDEYTLYEVLQAAIQGAIRPTTAEILSQKVAVINHKFDFRKTIATNMEILRAKVNRVTSYGITHDETEITLTLLANIDYATHHDWGRELRPAMQEIRKRYKYNHTHNEISLADILSELAAAYAIRTLSDAPEPSTESANAVNNTVSLFQDLMQAQSDYEESAFAVHSDSESSSNTCHKLSRGKSRERGNNGRGRSKSRDKAKGINNDCPGCKEFKRRKRHPNIDNAKCFWNRKYKGFRPAWICQEMEIPYKGRHKFSSDMGGYRSDSEEDK